MNSKFKKALAGATLSLAIGAMAIGIAGVGPALAATTQPGSGDVGLTESTTSASTTTLPWCGWYLTGIDATLALDASNSTYDGTEIDLTASDDGIEAFVNGSGTYSSATDNCSWYGSANQQAAWVSVVANSAAFTATTPADTDGTDSSMNFNLDSANKLNITVTENPDGSCVADGFTLVPDASVFDGTLSSNPIKSAASVDVTTTDRCAWSMNYATKIPGGKVPTYGEATYTFTGPTLTTTLDIQ